MGSLFEVRRDPLSFLTRVAREYGDVVRLRVGPADFYLLSHPDHVKDEEMTALTMAIVAKTLFDAEVEAEAHEIGEALTAIVDLFPRFSLPFARLLQALPLPSSLRVARAHIAEPFAWMEGVLILATISQRWRLRLRPGQMVEVAQTSASRYCFSVTRAEDVAGPEWAEWYRLTPRRRFEESAKLWQVYLALGGSLDPEPDTQSPFFDRAEASSRPAHGRPGVRVVRRSRV